MDCAVQISNMLEAISDEEFDNMTSINHLAGHLYVGDWKAGNDDKLLAHNNIEYIICLSKDEFNCSIPHHKIQIADLPSSAIDEYFSQTYSIILNCCQREQNILVMSSNGLSRSAIIALHYIMRRYYETGNEPCDDDLISMFKFYITRRLCDPESVFIHKLVKARDELIKKMNISN